MKTRHFLLLAMAGVVGCGKKPAAPDPRLGSRGTVEVTAKLLEVPEGAIIQRDRYDYATVLKYEVTEVHRGDVQRGAVIYVGHYNPWKPRAEAADRKVKEVGGDAAEIQGGRAAPDGAGAADG